MTVTGTPLTWHVGELPDADTSVIIITSGQEAGEGFHDGSEWRWASAAPVGDDLVVAWADLPNPAEVERLIQDGKGASHHG